MLDRKAATRCLREILVSRNPNIKLAHTYTLLARLHGLKDANVLAARPDALLLPQRTMLRTLQRFAAEFQVPLSSAEAEEALMKSGVSLVRFAQSVLTPWANWNGIHADLLIDLLEREPGVRNPEDLADLLEDAREAMGKYVERHPDTGHTRLGLIRAAHVLCQKLRTPQLSHPRQFLVVVESLGPRGDWRGRVVASPDFRYPAGSSIEEVVLFIPDGTRYDHQDGQAFLFKRGKTVVYSRSIRHSKRAAQAERHPGELVRFMLGR